MKKLVLGLVGCLALSLSAFAQHPDRHRSETHTIVSTHRGEHRHWGAGHHWSGSRHSWRGHYFGIGGVGFHDRVWWVNRGYTVILINGCWYYLDGNVLYPAYGYDPTCSYD